MLSTENSDLQGGIESILDTKSSDMVLAGFQNDDNYGYYVA